MELEHRFEVPVGIDTAWETLIDMNKVGPCFPGATLESVDGDDFTGSVKIKLGPIQLTYKGKATFVEKDPVRHTAKIEATGNAARSSSTAAMLVTATATAVSAKRTSVDLVTTLSITGRPAQFGRGVMIEVGNKLIGQFADCVAEQLTGHDAGGAELLEVDGRVVDESGTAVAAAEAGTAQDTAQDLPGRDDLAAELRALIPEPAKGAGAPVGATVGAHRTPQVRSAPPVDLLETAGAPILKRLIPLVLVVVGLIVLRAVLRKKSDQDPGAE